MPTKSYRCYFIENGERIRPYEEFACEDDAAAVLKVEELLASWSCGSAELWQETRLVGKWDSGASGSG